MSNAIDALLNRITMYRLVLYFLIFLLVDALELSIQGSLSYDPFGLLLSVSFLLAACAATNWIFGRTFGVPTNAESAYITALILVLIITPLKSYNDLWFLLWAAVLSMASKYILAINGKHLFNPAALAVAVTYFTINQSASWWVGNAQMLPFVLAGGLLIVRKIRRFDLVVSFLLTALVMVIVASLFSGSSLLSSFQQISLYSPLFFFAFVMLTEPLTTPPTRKLRIIYGVLTGFMFTPFIQIGSFSTTPELALLIGNVFTYLASPKAKLVLTLKDKTRLAPDTFEFVFATTKKLAFAPGQYMEWTLGHENADSRGNRRYFTLASSPTERDLRLGVKFYQHASSYKKALAVLNGEHEIVASQLAGEFTLPENPYQKCVFIAGGIGITPFRSMIKYLLDTRQRRSIILFYTNKSPEEIVYKDVFDRAERELGIKTVYAVTDPKSVRTGWNGLVGRITPEWITKYVPRYRTFVFYISGPTGMVNSFKATLRQMGVPEGQIKVDYFAGLT